MLLKWVLAALCGVLLTGTTAALAAEPTGDEFAKAKLDARHSGGGSGGGTGDVPRTKNFRVLGHHDLGLSETNADVWVHGNFAYVGTWGDPCNGRGVKILDVSDVSDPQLIGTLAARAGTSAEDMVVRRVSTPFFSGDLMAVGIQRCGEDPALDTQEFGLQLWNVTNPYAPVFLTEFGVGTAPGRRARARPLPAWRPRLRPGGAPVQRVVRPGRPRRLHDRRRHEPEPARHDGGLGRRRERVLTRAVLGSGQLRLHVRPQRAGERRTGRRRTSPTGTWACSRSTSAT